MQVEQVPPRSGEGERLIRRFRQCTGSVAVVGLGYVGLPTAVALGRAGFSVIGIDVASEVCDAVNQGRSHVADVEDDELNRLLRQERLTCTANPEALSRADAVIICVPTPLRKSKDPDLTAILAAGESVARGLRPGQLVVLESTTYPGTTEEILLPMFSRRGLRVSEDFFLAYSPERIDPGNRRYSFRDIPKIVGGHGPIDRDVAAALYAQITENVVVVSSTRVAEAAKLLENTFRSVNIALANEMALICHHVGVDVWEVVEAAGTKPFGFMAHYPGPGIGGHCIPLDPHYLAWKARLSGYDPQLIAVASAINGGMPHHVVSLITDALNDQGLCLRNSRVLVLGVAYKPNVGDCRESPAIDIVRALRQKGANVTYSDPFVPQFSAHDFSLSAIPVTPALLAEVDCTVIVTNHDAFDYEMIVRASKLVVDSRNATRRFRELGNVVSL